MKEFNEQWGEVAQGEIAPVSKTRRRNRALECALDLLPGRLGYKVYRNERIDDSLSPGERGIPAALFRAILTEAMITIGPSLALAYSNNRLDLQVMCVALYIGGHSYGRLLDEKRDEILSRQATKID